MEQVANSTTARGALGLEILADSCIFRLLHSPRECAEGFCHEEGLRKAGPGEAHAVVGGRCRGIATAAHDVRYRRGEA